MVFGDNPIMKNERLVPSIHAIMQAGNLYAYCMNNPVKFADPSGLSAQSIRNIRNNPSRVPQFIQDAKEVYRSQRFEAMLKNDKDGMDAADAGLISAYALASNFRSREEWGGAPSVWTEDMLKTGIVIHHSVNRRTIQSIEDLHTSNSSRWNFASTGYHFVIGIDGIVYEGRPLGAQGAHAFGHNPGNIGIALIGNFQPWTFRGNQTPTNEQLLSLVQLVNVLQDGQGISNSDTVTHRNLDPGNACPGENLYRILERLGWN